MSKTDFSNNPIKRRVQEILFKDIKANYCLGLAGPHPELYKEVLTSHAKNILLCDFNPSQDYVLHNSLCGAYDLNSSTIDWVDADFCSSIVTNQYDLMNIYNKLLMNKGEFWFTFNVALRGSTLAETQKIINYIFHRDTKYYQYNIIYKKGRKYIKLYQSKILTLIQYNDSGCHMLSGCIHEEPCFRRQVENYIKDFSPRLRNYCRKVIDLIKSNDLNTKFYPIRKRHPELFDKMLEFLNIKYGELMHERIIVSNIKGAKTVTERTGKIILTEVKDYVNTHYSWIPSYSSLYGKMRAYQNRHPNSPITLELQKIESEFNVSIRHKYYNLYKQENVSKKILAEFFNVKPRTITEGLCHKRYSLEYLIQCYKNNIIPDSFRKQYIIKLYSLDTKIFLKEFKSYKEASKFIGCSPEGISYAIVNNNGIMPTFNIQVEKCQSKTV